MNIFDLIYAEEHRAECEKDIKGRYPQAVLEDASDFLHIGRFSVSMEVDKNEWLLFLFTHGIFDLSLMSEMERFEDSENYIRLMKEAVEIKENE